MWSDPHLAGLQAGLCPQLWDQKAYCTYAVTDRRYLQLCNNAFSTTEPQGQENYLVTSDTSKSKVWMTFRILNMLKMQSTCPLNRGCPPGIPMDPQNHRCSGSPAIVQTLDLLLQSQRRTVTYMYHPYAHTHPQLSFALGSRCYCITKCSLYLKTKNTKPITTNNTEVDKHVALHLSMD